MLRSQTDVHKGITSSGLAEMMPYGGVLNILYDTKSHSAGSQDVGATSYQHGGFLMYISLFGNIMPQKEQPIITPARASIVAALTAFQVAAAHQKQAQCGKW